VAGTTRTVQTESPSPPKLSYVPSMVLVPVTRVSQTHHNCARIFPSFCQPSYSSSVSDAVAYWSLPGNLSTDSPIPIVSGYYDEDASLLKSHPFSEWRSLDILLVCEGRSRRFRHRFQLICIFQTGKWFLFRQAES